MAMNKRALLAAIDELVRSRGLMLIGGSFNLAAGLAIVLGHNVWSGGTLTVGNKLVKIWDGEIRLTFSDIVKSDGELSRLAGIIFRASRDPTLSA